MTDARFPERWLNDRRIRRLSADAFRTLMVAYVWSVANRTDGMILAADVDLMPMFDTGQVDELLTAELIQPRTNGWFLADYEATQSSRAELDRNDKLRVAERDRKRRDRAHKAGDHTHCPPDKGCRPDQPDPLSAGQPQDRTGQDRRSKAEPVEERINYETGEVLSVDASSPNPIPEQIESGSNDSKSNPGSAVNGSGSADWPEVAVPGQPTCQCGTRLVGIEQTWGQCRDCREEHAA